MLSVSGVIRSSHIEPRYFEPTSHVDALNRQEAKRDMVTSPRPLPSTARQDAGLDWTKLRQLVLTTRPSRLQIQQ